MWRPDDWSAGRIVDELSAKKAVDRQTTFYYTEAVEAGADTVIGALKEPANHVCRLETVKDCSITLEFVGGLKGWLVYIPDDKD